MAMHNLVAVVALLALLIPSEAFPHSGPPARIAPDGLPLFVVTVNGKDGFMDRDGTIVIEPCFDKAYPFTDGLAAFQRRGKWGFIDPQGHVVIEPQFVGVGLFSEGLATFQDKRHPDKHGYIDKLGRVVIEPQFDAAAPFRKGVARVGVATLKGKLLSSLADVGMEYDSKFIDRTGKVVPEPPPQHFATGEPGELIPFKQGEGWLSQCHG